jgi:hypothetical protein
MHDTPTATPAVPGGTLVGTVSDHPDVVLYTCNCDSQIAVRVLAELRNFAEATARSWRVVHEVYDPAPLDFPRRQRIGWRTVENLFAQGEVNGLIAPAEQEIAWSYGDRIALRTWLIGASAFAVYPQAGRYGHTRTHGAGNDEGILPPLVLTAPVIRHWATSYALHTGSLRQLRTDAHTQLSLLGWPGNIYAAVEVLARVAHNAITHAQPLDEAEAQMHVRLAVTAQDELLIDVGDPRPDFPHSASAIRGEKGRGLWDARRLGAKVSWILAQDGRSKTVRACLVPGEASA